jgi:hypothetical protein
LIPHILDTPVAILVEVQTAAADAGKDGAGIFRLLSEQGFKAYSINNDYSAAKYDAPARLTPVTNLRLHTVTDIFFLRGRLTDRVSELVVAV